MLSDLAQNPAKPTICYVHQYFRTPAMAGGTRSYELARRLAADGYNVIILTTAAGSSERPRWRQANLAGFTVLSYNSGYRQDMAFWNRVAAYCSFSVAATIKAISLRPSLVYASSTPLPVGIVGIFCKLMRSAQFIFEVRDVWPEVPIAMQELRNPFLISIARLLEKTIYLFADHIIALSPDMRESICARGVDSANVTVVPNGCDTPLFKTSDDQNEFTRQLKKCVGARPFLIYAGTLGRVNKVCYLSMLAEQFLLLDSNLCVVVVGAGAERATLEADAQQRGVLGNNLFLLPEIPKKQVPAVLSRAAAGISTVQNIKALAANSANKIFDYLSSGLPIIINHGGWLAELIEGDGCGIVLSPICDQRDAINVVAWLTDRAIYQESRSNAARLAATKFSRDSQYRVVRGLIDERIKSAERKKSLRRTQRGSYSRERWSG